jgi:hypothetical protein
MLRRHDRGQREEVSRLGQELGESIAQRDRSALAKRQLHEAVRRAHAGQASAEVSWAGRFCQLGGWGGVS